MAHSKPHTLDQLRRAFAEVWEDLGANHDGEEAQGMRTRLAVAVLELAGAGERSIEEIKATAKEIMIRCTNATVLKHQGRPVVLGAREDKLLQPLAM